MNYGWDFSEKRHTAGVDAQGPVSIRRSEGQRQGSLRP